MRFRDSYGIADAPSSTRLLRNEFCAEHLAGVLLGLLGANATLRSRSSNTNVRCSPLDNMHTALQPVVKVALSAAARQDLGLDYAPSRACMDIQWRKAYRVHPRALTELFRDLESLFGGLGSDAFRRRNAILRS